MANTRIRNGKVTAANTPENVTVSKGLYSFSFNAEDFDIRVAVEGTVDHGSSPPVGVLVPAGGSVTFRGYPEDGAISIESATINALYSIVETPVL